MKKKVPAKKAAPKTTAKKKAAPKKASPKKAPSKVQPEEKPDTKKEATLLSKLMKAATNFEHERILTLLRDELSKQVAEHRKEIEAFKKRTRKVHPSRIFPRPDDMQKAWFIFRSIELRIQAYDWAEIQYVGKDGDRVVDLPPIPHTMDGFEIFCRDHYGEVHQYFDDKDKLYGDFVAICSRIKSEIRNNQIIGGLLNRYNASITQRLNALKEQTEQTHIEQPLF